MSRTFIAVAHRTITTELRDSEKTQWETQAQIEPLFDYASLKAGIFSVNARIKRPVTISHVRQLVVVTLQVAGLLAISESGNFLARSLNVPVPGNVIGMLLLLGLLSTRVLRPEWIESGGGLLLKHLAFFFIPITVGLMELADVFRGSWPWLLLVVVISTAIGILAARFSAQAFSFMGKSDAPVDSEPATH